MGGIYQNGVFRLFQRSHRPMGIIIVPCNDILENIVIGNLFPLGQMFVLPAVCSRLWRRREDDFHIRIGQHHSANIPAIHHHIVFLGHIPL